MIVKQRSFCMLRLTYVERNFDPLGLKKNLANHNLAE